VIVFALIALTQVFSLDVLGWLLRRFTVFLGIALLVIFQPEIRRALAELGRQPRAALSAERRGVIDSVVQAVGQLSEHRVGALLAIERETGTQAVRETGVALDAPVVAELLASIFYPHTPMHDGGVIVADGRIAAAGCVFPLSQNTDLHRQMGMRHRAALGMSEETDAVVVVVSEETGSISACYRGRLSSGLDVERLHRFLAALMKGPPRESAWRRVQRRLDLSPQGLAASVNSEEQAKDHAAHT
jgi:diadenylate cyclase